MSALDLHAFVARSRVLVDSTPPATGRETRIWLVDPFLETLGWDVHADSCVTDTTVDGTALEYVCSVDGVPALFVATEPFGDSLDKSRAVALLETMAWTGIDRAIYTNGQAFLFLAGTTDVEQLACQLSSLSDHESALTHYSQAAVSRRLERHSRGFVARQLAVERPALLESIVTALTSATEQGDAYTTEFEAATERFLEQLVASFADDTHGPVAGDLESPSRTDVSVRFSETDVSEASSANQQPMTETEPSRDDTAGAASGDSKADATDTDSPTPRESDAGDSGESATTDDGEYVVRFFNDHTSIGAIGHSSSDQALLGTAEYLFDRGLSGVSIPWQPDETADDRAILNDSPTHADGSPMTSPQQLSNGLYLETAGTVDDHAARVEALVARAGLRAMLTGDWERE
ncbi:hypothetical protein [Natronorubrum thiooxidans]|uniref:Type I restriction enzyme R protein N terminus (HSDR_N) n=1 Tax=Natronorubrum thiooxidans TaxID=308853 RepID=A0A1N7DD57_9EURY|nr:hypothetical protein [Natronorubrum thiooxidans]SIR73704.1 hypothetical protein SAMN05421752_102165 [Natronorubrum thiooxidans]